MTPHVLMVDDNPGDLQLIEEAFKDCRIDVAFLAATEAQAAFDYLALAASGAEPRPDVLLLDLNMPGMDGREVIAALRRDPAWKHLPVVVLSGEKNVADMAADEIWAKPDTYAKYCALAKSLQRYWSGPRRSGRAAPPAASAATGAA